MKRQKNSSERGKPGSSRGKSKSTGEKGKHPFKKFMGPKGKPSAPKRANSNREEKVTSALRKSKEGYGDEKTGKHTSGRAPSGRRFFNKSDDNNRRDGKGGDKQHKEKKGFHRDRDDWRPRESHEGISPTSEFDRNHNRNTTPHTGKKQRVSDDRPPERTGKYSKYNDHKSGRGKEKRFKRDEFVSGEGFQRQTPNRESKGSHSVKPKGGADNGLIRLNKYLSNAGIASRRDADTLIISGAVKVNGVVVNQLGAKIQPGDKVTYGDQSVKGERKVYLLLNKPKDYITTMEDERDRKTVMKLVEGACKERIYPVGRLDRNTTGLLLMTNDGELTTKLTHPKHGIKKVYHVSLNKGLKPEHFKEIMDGIELEDGLVKVDDLAFVGEGKKEVGVELHSGRNRVVRRLFEHLGYDVIKLDRVVFAGLTKKDLPRGKYRFLSAKEISFLQMIG